MGKWGGAANYLDKTTHLNKMIKPSRRDDITHAISNNVLPTRNKSSNDLILRLDGKQYTKLQQRGKTTPTNRFYFTQTNTTESNFNIEGTLVQRGSTDFLVSGGKSRVLRRLVGDDYQYTRLGKQYFSTKRIRYLVHVPAVIKKGPKLITMSEIDGATQHIHGPISKHKRCWNNHRTQGRDQG